jgi:TolA-binding protein
MNAKVIISSTLGAGLLGLGALLGSVVGTVPASAQTPSATVTATATAKPADSGTTTTAPPADAPFGMRGGRGHGGGPGDFLGRGATADNATQQITSTNELIGLVESDVAYANGKMDTADVQRWLDSARSLVQKAQTANTGSQYGASVAYSGAARELAMVAYSKMADTLTAAALPSNGQIRGEHMRGPVDTATAPTQAQASYVLANTYNRLVGQGAVIGTSSEGAAYLTEAQGAYRDAYNAYQSGNYENAVTFARLAEKLAGVASRVAGAVAAPANADTPVTVPAPNF